MASIDLIKGDITKIEVDAIVNAANKTLLGGGGVDGAIHKAGGFSILKECMGIVAKQGGCEVGEAVITTAGDLPAKKVIHTVGPFWQGGKNGEYELLGQCYFNSLLVAMVYGMESIAFPNISTGVYKFPKAEACAIAIDVVTEFLIANAGEAEVVKKVIFVCFDDENYDLYKPTFDSTGLK